MGGLSLIPEGQAPDESAFTRLLTNYNDPAVVEQGCSLPGFIVSSAPITAGDQTAVAARANQHRFGGPSTGAIGIGSA